ncbi:hypothetical protein ACYVL9_003821 [Vibrio fluvialis]|jgi:hypothetical protein|uniref:50S ribosomal protein L20 n=2 Tax=Vibrio fluvialis TaxID=676 RepID=A0AAX2LUI2_VIBFL|nr:MULTISPECIES: hypothetical protein [Vibrio]ADT87832.1 hypothetical protein vfu_A02716 [Vibrio furnissii NCTC 11218]EEX38827.1 hypothetical protein VFA_004382 [Vibrio furnissii CIP 102972]EPP25536.1 hypothetical protein L910_0689 [Vibrio fluvialis PG41]EPP25840.1 hypothetical protein L911_0806 [Vibrio fluvialis I21563]MDE5179393.1 hypothetical protein [Vibrio fluvialis]
MLKRKRHSKLLSKAVSANRRRRMLANTKKKVLARHRAFVQLSD